MLKKPLAFALTVLTVGTGSLAQSALVLNLNTADQTFAFTGSDTGQVSVLGSVTWQALSFANPGAQAVGYSNDVAFTTSVGTPGFLTLPDTNIQTGASQELVINLTISDALATTTLTGTGVFQSYAPLGPATVALEEFIGETIAVDPAFVGGGWSPIQVQAVPEPASLLVIGGALAAFARRRRA